MSHPLFPLAPPYSMCLDASHLSLQYVILGSKSLTRKIKAITPLSQQSLPLLCVYKQQWSSGYCLWIHLEPGRISENICVLMAFSGCQVYVSVCRWKDKASHTHTSRNSEKRDVKETFKENKGIHRTLLGKKDHGLPWSQITHNYTSYFSPSHSYLRMERDRAFVTLQKMHQMLAFISELCSWSCPKAIGEIDYRGGKICMKMEPWKPPRSPGAGDGQRLRMDVEKQNRVADHAA